jgi:hypothetical protein
MSFGGSSEPQRTVQTTQQAQTFPEELKPYISDILSRGQTRMQDREAEGFQPYVGPRLAEFTPEMLQARQGLTGLVNQGLSSDTGLSSALPYFGKAQTLADRASQEFDADTANQYMSPYMQSVVDIEKREAERVGDVQAQQIGDAAVKSGGFGGSRQAIREAEQARNENQLQADIQTRGTQAAYESGLAAFQGQKARDAGLASQLQSMGSQAYNQAVTEQGQLAKIGEQGQAQGQRSLDLEYQKFLDEKTAPDRALQDYSGLVRGYYMAPDTGTTSVTQKPAASLGTQLMGAAATGAGLFNAFKKEGGLVGLANGGTVGLQTGGQPSGIGPIDRGDSQYGTGAENIKAAKVKIVKEAEATGTDPRPALAALNKALADNTAKRQQLAMQNEKDIKRDKWLELAKFGTNVMKAGDSGEGILSAVGSAGADSIEGLQAINKGERDFAARQASDELSDLGMQAKLESAQFEADRDYKLKLAELAAETAAAGGFDEANVPKEGELDSMVVNIGGAYLQKNPKLRDKASAIVLSVMEDLNSGNLAYARATGIRTAIKKEIRRRMVEAGIDANSSGVGIKDPNNKVQKTSQAKKPFVGTKLKSIQAAKSKQKPQSN